MAPTAKDVETLTATSASTVAPSSTVAKNPQDTTTRPQPVPLEVPVSVNGARTIEGSDKREPFSEATKTVLVFANGAVIRLASHVSPGQLLFVTNDKTKKEVVCQVVKSKNYRTVTGYVELEFTEPAAGFWGVRIPEPPAVASGAAKAPIAARPAAPTTTPTTAVPKSPTAVPHAPHVPVAAKPNIPAVTPVKPAVVPPAPAPVISAKPETVNGSVQAKEPAAAKPEAKLPTVAEFLASSIAPPQPSSVKAEALPAQLAEQLSALVNTNVAAPPAVNAPPAAAPANSATQSSDSTTDELRQQAARLQEQLSSLLFRAENAEKKNAQATITAPKAAMEIPVPAIPVIPQPEPAVRPAAVEAKIAPAPIPVTDTKTISSVAKSTQFNLKVEEVKIPAWLAPLARETESGTQSFPAQDAASTSTSTESEAQVSTDDSSVATEEKSATSQSVVFGGQLLGGAGSEAQEAPSSGSKTGLILGLAAAAVLVVGGVWYGLQPGNFLAGKSAVAQSNITNSPAAAIPASIPVASPTASATNSAPINSAPPAVVGTHPTAATQPASALAVPLNKATNAPAIPETKSANLTTARTAPPVEQPKKPSLGDVHLATPNVNRGGSSASNEAAPSIDSADATTAGDPLAGIAASNGHQPTAPLPVGGDVKAAQLLKSVPPVYPSNAKTQRVAGDVKIDALIDATGNVSTTKILSGPVLLHQAAMVAVKQWKYQPAQLDGKPTAMHLTVTVQFRLQ
ncbi:MAG TPA: TonB family protein [Candidatus Acidoferrum sp.]|jgi:protein TonB